MQFDLYYKLMIRSGELDERKDTSNRLRTHQGKNFDIDRLFTKYVIVGTI